LRSIEALVGVVLSEAGGEVRRPFVEALHPFDERPHLGAGRSDWPSLNAGVDRHRLGFACPATAGRAGEDRQRQKGKNYPHLVSASPVWRKMRPRCFTESS